MALPVSSTVNPSVPPASGRYVPSTAFLSSTGFPALSRSRNVTPGMGCLVYPSVFTTLTRVGAFLISTVPLPVRLMLVEPAPTYPRLGVEVSVSVYVPPGSPVIFAVPPLVVNVLALPPAVYCPAPVCVRPMTVPPCESWNTAPSNAASV